MNKHLDRHRFVGEGGVVQYAEEYMIPKYMTNLPVVMFGIPA